MSCLYQLPAPPTLPLPAARVDYPGAVHAADVQLPLYGEDLERGDLRD
jgi:hypothetical protein